MRLGHLDGGRLPTVWNVAWITFQALPPSQPQYCLRGAISARNLSSTQALSAGDRVGHMVWNPTLLSHSLALNWKLSPRTWAAAHIIMWSREEGRDKQHSGILSLLPISHVEYRHDQPSSFPRAWLRMRCTGPDLSCPSQATIRCRCVSDTLNLTRWQTVIYPTVACARLVRVVSRGRSTSRNSNLSARATKDAFS